MVGDGMIYEQMPDKMRREMPIHVRCIYCRMAAICIPVIIVPVLNWTSDAYLMIREPGTDVVRGLCGTHKLTFSINHFTDYYGSWYDMIRSHLESYSKRVEIKRMVGVPAKDPRARELGFTDTKEVGTGQFQTIRGGYKVGERKDCRLVYWIRVAPTVRPMWGGR